MTEERRNRLLEPVPWSVWVWSVVIVTGLLAAMFAQTISLNSALAKERDERIAGDQVAVQQNNEIKVQLSAIQADLKNLEYLIKQAK